MKPVWVAALVASVSTLAGGLGCQRGAGDPAQERKVLDFGDAEWERPPFAVPGGGGDSPEDSGYGSDTAGSPGGTSGASGDGWDTSDPSGWTSSGDTSSGGDTDGTSSGGDTEGTSSGGDTDTDTDTDTDASSSGSTSDGSAPDGAPAEEPKQLEQRRKPAQAAAPMCPAAQEPAIFYMSNDDSNSQASPVLARHTIRTGGVVDPFRVRIHEFLNYYDMSYENPTDRAASVGLQMRRTDAEIGEFVLLAYAQGRQVAAEKRAPMNLVFSLDTSGSMSGPPIELLRETVRAVTGSLLPGDVVSMVTWSTEQDILLNSHAVTGPNDPTLLAIIDGLDSDGGTDLHGGLTAAYALAEANHSRDRINRVMLISDGGANAGVTDLDIISGAANDSDSDGIYLVGVGVGDATGYRDDLMDDVTDAGKGAYIFIDSAAEAQRMFGANFVQNMDVAARNVKMELTMPWYFAITEFHGEEYSKDPAEVDPQHLGPNDAMSYHQLIQACDPNQIHTTDPVKAKITYEDPQTGDALSEELELTIGQIVKQSADQLYKGDVIVAYAQSLIVIGDLHNGGSTAEAKQIATDMVTWLAKAEESLNDPDITEMRDLMATLAQTL